MPVIAAIGAIALIGYIASVAMKEARQERDFRAANGYSLDEVLNALIDGFDRNGDGRLAFDAIKGLRTLGEGSRQWTRTFTERVSGWGIPDGTMAVKERTTLSTIEPLLRVADANHDGVATRAELLAVLRAYDPDGNGRMTSADRGRVLAEHGSVTMSSTTRTIGIIPPPAKKPAPPVGASNGPQPAPAPGSPAPAPRLRT